LTRSKRKFEGNGGSSTPTGNDTNRKHQRLKRHRQRQEKVFLLDIVGNPLFASTQNWGVIVSGCIAILTRFESCRRTKEYQETLKVIGTLEKFSGQAEGVV
jgi:hypothetical protein